MLKIPRSNQHIGRLTFVGLSLVIANAGLIGIDLYQKSKGLPSFSAVAFADINNEDLPKDATTQKTTEGSDNDSNKNNDWRSLTAPQSIDPEPTEVTSTSEPVVAAASRAETLTAQQPEPVQSSGATSPAASEEPAPLPNENTTLPLPEELDPITPTPNPEPGPDPNPDDNSPVAPVEAAVEPVVSPVLEVVGDTLNTTPGL